MGSRHNDVFVEDTAIRKAGLDPRRPVGWESRKSYALKIENGFFDRYLSGAAILEIGYRGYADGVVPILPQAVGIDLDYPGYDGINLPFPDESQDAVYTSHCLEHVSDYKNAVKEWFRVVKRGGYLVIIVPHQFLYEKRAEPPSWWNPDHKRFYTPARLLHEIEEALEPNTYRVRHLVDNDQGFDYSLPRHQGSSGCQEIELVVQKIQPPNWTLKDTYPASDFRSWHTLARPNPLLIETDFSVSNICVAFGPYVRLPSGGHEATFHVKAIGLDEQELASPITFDIGQDTSRIASIEIVGREGRDFLRNEKIPLCFENKSPESLFEFRIFTFGRPFQGKFMFLGVSLHRL